MANIKIFLNVILFLMIIGLVTPFLLGYIIDVSQIETGNSLMSPVIDFVDDGISLLGVSLNPFDLLFGFKSYLVDSLTFFALLPNFIIAIIGTFVLLTFILTLWSLIRGA